MIIDAGRGQNLEILGIFRYWTYVIWSQYLFGDSPGYKILIVSDRGDFVVY